MNPRREILCEAHQDLEQLKRTLKEAKPESLARAWGVLGLFAEFLPTLMDSTATRHRTSAFCIYYTDSVHLARRGCTETFSFYYGIGHSLLRSVLESLIRGAFWEGTAHKQFRENARVIRRTGTKIGTETKTLLNWFADTFKRHPNSEDELEQMSAVIFDKTAALFTDRSLSRVVPRFKKMLEQVTAWGLLRPIEEPILAINEHLYWELSKDAHLIPDKTLLGRRFVAGKGPMPSVEYDAGDLESFVEALRCVVDVGIVLSTNLVSLIGAQHGGVPKKFPELNEKVEKLLPDFYAARLLKG